MGADTHGIEPFNPEKERVIWLTVDEDGEEIINKSEPILEDSRIFGKHWCSYDRVEIPNGTIKKLIGRDITLKESPVKLKIQEL